VLAALSFFCLLKPVHGQIKAGTSFYSIPPNYTDYGSSIFPKEPYYNDNYLHFYPLANGCAEVSIKSINYQNRIVLKKDSFITIRLPDYWPRFGQDSALSQSIAIKSSVPVNLYQACNNAQPIDLKDTSLVTFPFRETLINTHALSLTDNLAFEQNTFQYFTHPLGNSIYENNDFLNALHGLHIFNISLGSENNLRSYFNCYLTNFRGSAPRSLKDTLFFNLGYGQLIWRSMYINNSSGIMGNLNWANEGFTESTNAKPFKTFAIGALDGYSFENYFGASQNTRPLIEPQETIYTTFVELKPQRQLSYSHHFPAFTGYAGQTLSLQAFTDSTQIFVNGNFLVQMNRSKRFDTIFREDLSITSTAPISAIVHPWPDTLGNYIPPNGVRYSHFALQANTDGELIYESKVPSLHTNLEFTNIISLVTRTGDTAALTINGQRPQGQWQKFTADTSWSFVNESVPLGIHHVKSQAGFHGYYYITAPFARDTLYPNYGYVLTEYAPWPADSFMAYLGSQQQPLVSFSDWADTSIRYCPGDTIYVKPPSLRHTHWQWWANDSLLSHQIVGEKAGEVMPLIIPNLPTFELRLVNADGCTPIKQTIIRTLSFEEPALVINAKNTCAGLYLDLQLENKAIDEQITWWFQGQSEPSSIARFMQSSKNDSLVFALVRQKQGCTDSISYHLSLADLGFSEPSFPNVLTPNGDGQNDAWCFAEFQGFEGCFQVQIANRWGGAVYNTTNPNACWQPPTGTTGTFFYTLQYGTETHKGFISLF
jgi:gliding motility-associated-like protein